MSSGTRTKCSGVSYQLVARRNSLQSHGKSPHLLNDFPSLDLKRDCDEDEKDDCVHQEFLSTAPRE